MKLQLVKMAVLSGFYTFTHDNVLLPFWKFEHLVLGLKPPTLYADDPGGVWTNWVGLFLTYGVLSAVLAFLRRHIVIKR